MNRLALLLLLPLPLWADDGSEDKAPSAQVLRTALQWMQSNDPARRKAAYRSVHLLGREALPSFTAALRKARQFHTRRLSDLLNDKSRSGNPYLKLESVAEELGPQRERVYALITTDFQKKQTKIRMLVEEMEGLERIYQRAAKIVGEDPATFDAKINALAGILAELAVEIARFEDNPGTDPDTPADELRRKVLTESFDGDRYLQGKARFDAVRKEVMAHAAVDSANARCSWANSRQKDFTKHLNGQRAVLGLDPLALEEFLSKAANGHSSDMSSMGFFDHTSPVKGKRSPSDRARLAGFKGRWTGENIFMGSTVYTAAYNGWFGSDGHRFIMFAKGPDLIGLGPIGKYWTLMTGKK